MIVIVKNFNDYNIMIKDLGIEIPLNSEIDLSELFNFFEIMTSDNLKSYVDNGILIINDGDNDLNGSLGVEYLTFK